MEVLLRGAREGRYKIGLVLVGLHFERESDVALFDSPVEHAGIQGIGCQYPREPVVRDPGARLVEIVEESYGELPASVEAPDCRHEGLWNVARNAGAVQMHGDSMLSDEVAPPRTHSGHFLPVVTACLQETQMYVSNQSELDAEISAFPWHDSFVREAHVLCPSYTVPGHRSVVAPDSKWLLRLVICSQDEQFPGIEFIFDGVDGLSLECRVDLDPRGTIAGVKS